MTSVQFLFPENRLAKLVRQPGGVGQQQAMTAAAANLETISGELLAAIDQYLAQIEALGANPALSQDPALQAEMYQSSNYVAGMAGHCGRPELGRAAYTLCEVLDRFLAGATWSAPAVIVHLDALKLLRQMDPAAPEAASKAVIDGLRSVTERIVRPPEAPDQPSKAE